MNNCTDSSPERERVGPIIFADETARERLCTAGSVVTFRRNRRTTGETWWRASRTGPKQGDVTVEEIGEVAPVTADLQSYRAESGFESVQAWRWAIEDVNGFLPESGYLYRATSQTDREAKTDG